MKSLKLILTHKRYFSAVLLFLSLNVLFGTWAIYIPRITENLNISEGELGFAVFFLALGTLSMIPFVPKLLVRFGLGRVMAFAITAFCISFAGPFAAPNYFWLCASLYIIGAFSGLTDVTMNTLVTHMEKEDKIQFMSLSHAFFSLGGMLGAGVGTLLIPIVPSALVHVIAVILLLLFVNFICMNTYIYLRAEKAKNEEGFKLKHLRPLLGLAIISFMVMAAEGAIVDWSALYLERVTLAAAGLFGFGYAVFNGMMAFGRFFGDAVSNNYGSRKIIIAGCILAALGFGLVLSGMTWVAISGFGFVGLGLSVVVPELFRYSGNLTEIEAAEGISFIAGSGFVGLLLGPVFLGFLAQSFNLKSSFFALLCFVLIAAFLGFFLKRK
ncbi:MFS transporter [Flavimarina sp. Hel_I_48]|uniref:MFS transporter n=1 Tax=Flavimarina sp. Hel_I_48 TaxID=1392488 RepID=UPI0004DF62B3|nr:MFS transporter [Flavimarina sp. Hel_I_48]